MTQLMYENNPYIFRFEAKVLSCEKSGDKFSVTLDRTGFFPEGGGQECDLGTIAQSNVLSVYKKNGEVIHVTDGELEKDSVVECTVDAQRRIDFMQNHTGEHILSGVLFTEFGVNNVGFHLGSDTVTIDLDSELTKEQLFHAEDIANRYILEDRPIHCYYPDAEKLKDLDLRKQPDIDDKLRVVEIEGVDMCACCAPHLPSTSKVWMIKIVRSEKMRCGSRVHFYCGARAMSDYSKKNETAYEISSIVSLPVNDITKGVQKLVYEITDLRSEIKMKNDKISDLLAKDIIFDVKSRRETKTVKLVSDIEQKGLSTLVEKLIKELDLVLLFCPLKSGYAYMCAKKGGESDLKDIDRELKRFGAKGGGTGDSIQGVVPEQVDIDMVIRHMSKEIGL